MIFSMRTFGRQIFESCQLTRLIVCLAVSVCSLSEAERSVAQTPPPNIVVVLMDDMGWNGTSALMDPTVPNSKSDFYQTPRIEQLASQAMRFSQGYSSHASCAPSRAAIITGKSPAQQQMTDLPHYIPGSTLWESTVNVPLVPPVPEQLDPTGLTLPRMIKQANSAYKTSHIGKWHLDVPASISPTSAGYDQALYAAIPNMEIDPWGVNNLATTANNWMTQQVNSGTPFFTQLSYFAVHDPIQSRQVMRDKYSALPPGAIHKNVEYAAMTEDFDTSLGKVLDKIDELGIADNTYVFFVSDNGGWLSLSSQFPLKLGKGTLSEGGIRTPFMVRGPGIAPGTFSNVPVSTTDLYSTIADIVNFGGPVPSNVESGNILPVLQNGGVLPAGMDHIARNFTSGGELYWHMPTNVGVGASFRVKPQSAIRDGDFKLVVEWGENGNPDVQYLYNLANNISETVNLVNSQPAKTAELRAKLDNYLTAVDASFAYDVKAPVAINWDATTPGTDAAGWRSTNDLKYKGRETWKLGAGTQAPTRITTQPFQPNLPKNAFHFDGGDVMRQSFIQVADDGPRRSRDPGTPDWNRSATMEFWVKFDTLQQNQVLFESGDGSAGISVTLGDSDNDGIKNDLRFRVLGKVGADNGAAGTLTDYTITTKINEFANPTQDFVHLTTVFNDDPNNRYQEIYVNGALAGRLTAPTGTDNSPQWDGYDMAGLGGTGGNGLGGNGGAGNLPFLGGFRGDFAKVKFYNYAVTPTLIRDNYNAALSPVNHAIASSTGSISLPSVRPTDLTHGLAESASLQIIHERTQILNNSLSVDALLEGGTALNNAAAATAGQIASGVAINSYLFQFDPLGENAAAQAHALGTVNFMGDILGLIFESSSLASTDSVLGSIGDYGLASDRGFSLGPEGSISVSANQRGLNLDLSVLGDQMLQFRVITRRTTPGLKANAADFNADGTVDGLDLIVWQNSYRTDNLGDADNDGDTDGRDFLIWQQLYGTGSLLSAASQVPEPSSLVLCALAALTLAASRRQR
jgi:arylsulfatase A